MKDFYIFLRFLLVKRGKSGLKWLNYIGVDLLVSSYCACDLLLSVYLLFVDACVCIGKFALAHY